MYENVLLFIDGTWCRGSEGDWMPVKNPATGEVLARVARASMADVRRAAESTLTGFRSWSAVSAFDRYLLMRKAANLLRERADGIARLMTMEQGKPLAEALGETLHGADVIDWFAEEARRAYGRVIPPRKDGVYQLVIKEPVGPVAAFTPWNFPINQAVRKMSAAIAAGCSIVLRGPGETPASCAALVKVFVDAGLPSGVVTLLFGAAAEISEYLIGHPNIRKITFTGSTAVGKHLAMLAGSHMKRITMELGGNAPAVVFDDADIDVAVQVLSSQKFRNAGQVCVSPTRFLVHADVYDQFVDGFAKAAEKTVVGNGLDPTVQMGPLANDRRVEAMEELVSDAVAKGATVKTGGRRIGNVGNFYAPTVLEGVSSDSRLMNEEPFGPVAPIIPFTSFDEVVAESNRLPYGLAAYAYTRSLKTANMISSAFESGMVSINHHGFALPELPFGGIKDSGYGTEGGADALDAYLNTKFVTQIGL
ncbi:MAG: NAD-dependent succinate-semialdehyde dehydrogenase [Mesorhizobium sp.]|uniref:NAD-dependent succinate-semialdehyde dehydrogenase n=1 Tax=Mesorhizobium sp. TaxID=1871066 RepID=UPI000FE6B1C8|nr:NAD-dependent succinate-semialdehyde dehydrogenase [Mesorhizobium sp.]RWI54719.1 MAG: NAD-dependent succinate-semialdehyde dehydrogenase [Mesorhizobium sp.]